MASPYDFLLKYTTVTSSRGPEVEIPCPQCGSPQGLGKFSFNINFGVGRCWRASCGYRTNFPSLVTRVAKVSFSEAYEIVRRYSDGLDESYKTSIRQFTFDYPRNAIPIADLEHYQGEKTELIHSLADKALDYLLHTRNLSYSLIEKYRVGLGYEDFVVSGNNVPRYGMVVIPIVVNGEIVSYIERRIDTKFGPLCMLKHYAPVEAEGYLPKGQVLFNCDYAFDQAWKNKKLVVVEDAWSAMKLNCLGVLGTNLTGSQIELLTQNWKGTVVLLFDNDEGGRRASNKLAIELSKYYNDVRIAKLVNTHDPDDDVSEAMRSISSAEASNTFSLQLSKVLS